MAQTGVKRWAWPTAALLAASFLFVLAFHGQRPEPGLARFEAAGVLSGWRMEDVVSIEIGQTAQRLMFRRESESWRTDAGTVSANVNEAIETGLKLLRNSAPQRSDLSGDALDEFGLSPPHLVVAVRIADGASVTIEFGASNPLGLERYARITGRAEIMTVASFVADAWDRVAAMK